jgi:hypothetical protein
LTRSASSLSLPGHQVAGDLVDDHIEVQTCGDGYNGQVAGHRIERHHAERRRRGHAH